MLAVLESLYDRTPTVERAEIELLLLCARPTILPSVAERIQRLLAQPIDWGYFIQCVAEHKVVNLVFTTLKGGFEALVPGDQLDRIHAQYVNNVWRSLRLNAELIRIVKLLEAHHIEVLPLKGPVLASMLYHNRYLREYKDLDILVHKRDVEAAEKLLTANGYRRNQSEDTVKLFSPFDDPYHVSLIGKHKGRDVELELHWSVTISFLPFTLDNETIWDYTTTVDIQGDRFRVLEPEEFLMLLAMHGAKHRWNWLKWICDIAAFLERYPALDWGRVIAKVEEFRSKRVLLLNLWLASHLLEAPLPDVIQQHIAADGLIKPLGTYVRRWIFNQSQPDSPISQVRVILFFLLIREHLRDRWPYILHTIWHVRSDRVRNLSLAILAVLVLLIVLLMWVALRT